MVQRNRKIMIQMCLPNTLGCSLYRNMSRHDDNVHFAKTQSNLTVMTKFIKEAVTVLFAYSPDDRWMKEHEKSMID